MDASEAGWRLNVGEPGFRLWVNQIPDTETGKTEGVREGAAKPREATDIKAAEATSALGSSVHQQKCICRLRASTEDLTSALYTFSTF